MDLPLFGMSKFVAAIVSTASCYVLFVSPPFEMLLGCDIATEDLSFENCELRKSLVKRTIKDMMKLIELLCQVFCFFADDCCFTYILFL